MLGDTQHAATKTSKHNSYAVAGALGQGWDSGTFRVRDFIA